MSDNIRVFFVDEPMKKRKCFEVQSNVTLHEFRKLVEKLCPIQSTTKTKFLINNHIASNYNKTFEEIGINDGSVIKMVSEDYQIDNKMTNTKYPLFVRNTRIKSLINREPIKILEPESIPTKPEINIVTTLLPTLLMFGLVVVLRGFMGNSNGTFVIFSICSMGLGLFTSVMNLVNKKRDYRKTCEQRKNKYLNYISEKKLEIERERKDEKECLEETYYSIDEDIQHIEDFSPYLFDRIPNDEDYLDVYLGTGKILAQKAIDFKEQEKLESEDEISIIPSQIAYDYKYIADGPVFIKLKDANAIGIVSDEKYQYDFMKNFIIDMITRQYYGDLNLYVFIDEKDREKYNWLELVPHIQQKTKQF